MRLAQGQARTNNGSALTVPGQQMKGTGGQLVNKPSTGL